MRLATDQWVELLTDGKDEFGADGAAAVFSTWRVEGDVDGAGRLDLDARMIDGAAARLLGILPEEAFLLRIKFLRGRDGGDWALKDKFDPVRVEGKKGGTVLEIASDTKPGVFRDQQGLLPKLLPHYRGRIRPLPDQGPRSRQSCSVEAR